MGPEPILNMAAVGSRWPRGGFPVNISTTVHPRLLKKQTRKQTQKNNEKYWQNRQKTIAPYEVKEYHFGKPGESFNLFLLQAHRKILDSSTEPSNKITFTRIEAIKGYVWAQYTRSHRTTPFTFPETVRVLYTQKTSVAGAEILIRFVCVRYGVGLWPCIFVLQSPPMILLFLNRKNFRGKALLAH